MTTIDKLLKLISNPNIASVLDDEELAEVTRTVIKGLEVDTRTREKWLKVNQNAVEIIKHAENVEDSKDDLFDGQCNIVYPLLGPAIIQLASRLSTHTVRNGRTVECEVLGTDQQIPDPEDILKIQQIAQSPEYQQAVQEAQQTGQQLPQLPQPKLMWMKKDKSSRVSNFMNYQFLVENRTWLSDDAKLDMIVSGWGVGWKQVYYDKITRKNCSELLDPESVIINHNVSSLKEAPRVSVLHYLNKNEIISYIRAGYFLDLDLNLLKASYINKEKEQDLDEEDPVYEFVCQTVNLDLDDDGYAEPYKCYVHTPAEMLFCIIPAFETKDIEVIDDKESKYYGQIRHIERRLDIVDRHLIDSPDGKYYSLGLNYLLLHSNKAITSILQLLVNAGILKNAASVSGFITKAFKTRERNLRMPLGSFEVLDCDPSVDPQAQVLKMPMDEPSQVLLALLQFLVETSKNSGFISDILSGDVEMQNVPATTALAAIEQSTRSFKPMIAKKYMSLQDEFKMHFHFNSLYLDQTRYARFQGKIIQVTKDDFNEDETDISPVADPTVSSEAQTFAKCRALIEGLTAFGAVTNQQEAALRYYTDMQFENPDKLIQVQQQGPDPKILEIQLKAQELAHKQQLEGAQTALDLERVKNDKLKTQLAFFEAQVRANEVGARTDKLRVDAHRDAAQTAVLRHEAGLHAKEVDIEAEKVKALREDKAQQQEDQEDESSGEQPE